MSLEMKMDRNDISIHSIPLVVLEHGWLLS